MTTTIPFEQRLSCTIEEACQATGIGRTKLYEEMTAGRVETTRVGGRRLVLVASLKKLLGIRAISQGAPTSKPEAA
jgi:excisionase family DNA binding protein